MLALAALVAAARLSEAFLVLKAQTVAMPLSLVPAVMIVMSAVYAASSYPPVSLRMQRGSAGCSAGHLPHCLPPMDFWPLAVASRPSLQVQRCGAFTWGCRRACYPRWSQTLRPQRCAGGVLVSTISHPALRRWPLPRQRECFGTDQAQRLPLASARC